jgi:hypothetical protein
MSSCLWKVGPTAITHQTKSFEGLDRDAAHGLQ